MNQILTGALAEYSKLFEQIGRIISSYESGQVGIFTSREEASEAIDNLLSVLPRKQEELKTLSNKQEKDKEILKIRSALSQALDAAKTFKLTKSIQLIEAEITSLESINNTNVDD